MVISENHEAYGYVAANKCCRVFNEGFAYLDLVEFLAGYNSIPALAFLFAFVVSHGNEGSESGLIKLPIAWAVKLTSGITSGLSDVPSVVRNMGEQSAASPERPTGAQSKFWRR